ncbi:hypothetical protein SLS62_000758 [Diatrype stigma]|uniref:Ribonucleases P/MRP subunit Pop8-like domain-containing protein n=1 Tax=Diatrype stigma TaxID=117547 RepID=A0AAN9UX54_9PEZI
MAAAAAEQADAGDGDGDTPMTGTIPHPQASAASVASNGKKTQKFHELATCTIRAPPFAYAHLELFNSTTAITSTNSDSDSESSPRGLDALQVRSYCTAALRQFLGVAGEAIPLDVLQVRGRRCWVRVPRDDLGAFAAAVTAWQGVVLDGAGDGGDGGRRSTLRILGCSDWLGTLVGGRGEERLWSG